MKIKNQHTGKHSEKNGIPSEKEMLETWENYTKHKNDFPKPDLDSLWDKTTEEIGWKKRRIGFFRNSFFRYAAAILLPVLVIGSGVYFSVIKINNSLNYASYESPAGERSKIELPDGSTIWLQPNSKIKYPKEFKADLREIEFSGQGYFDIQENPEIPFVVHIDNMNVTVLGTQFYIKANQSNDLIETGLISGKVKISTSRIERILSPNNVLVYSKSLKDIKESKDLLNNKFHWDNGSIVFENCRFVDVLTEISDWYDIDLEINPELELDTRITLTIREESINEILEILKIIVPFEFHKKQDKIVVSTIS